MAQAEIVVANLDINLTKEDVVSIAVARAEVQLGAERKELEKKEKSLREEQQKLVEDMNKAVAKFAEDKAKPRLKILGKFSKDFPNLEAKSLYNINGSNVTIDIYLTTGDRGWMAVETLKFPLPTEYNEINKQVGQTTTDIQDVQAKICEVRKQLSQLGSLERQFRAKLAEDKLRQMKGGAELIDSLLSDVNKKIGLLPG